MQFDKVDPATCKCVSYCPQATPPKTNADRIRSMTDEELGKLLNEFGHCPLSRIEDECRSFDRCRDCWIDWLKEEVKHEA